MSIVRATKFTKPAAPAPSVRPPASSETLGTIVDLESVALIVIHDAWSGYNPDAPLLRSYQLQRTGRGGFEGAGTFSTATAGPERIDVKLTPKHARAFLEALGKVVLRDLGSPPDDDAPMEVWTDDYPHVEIALYVPREELGKAGGFVLLTTTAQGEFHVPWTVTVGQRTCATYSREIAHALKALETPLRWSTLDDLTGPARKPTTTKRRR